ncbi:MFS transporter [Leucobacter soli]|nr:MFS transporter [Leucobacter soli]
MTSSLPIDATSPHPRRWWILVTVAIAQLMVVLDATVVNIALPSAQSDLGFSDNDRQWVITAYALAFGGLLLLGGRLADVVGRRAMFLVGLFGFAAASALGGAAQTLGFLIGARALQGAFAAMLAPAALSVLTMTFTIPRERSRAFGVYGALTGAGGAIGLLLGGFLTESLNWRWTLFINVFFAIVAAIGGLMLLHGGRAEKRPSLDLLSTGLGGVGLFLLVFGFSRAEPEGWGSPRTWLPLVGSAILLTAFVLRQRLAAARALLPLSVIADRNRGASFIAILANGAGMFGAFLFGTYYLQSMLAYTPLQTGLAFLPQIVVLAVAAQVSTNFLLPRFGPKIIVASGLLIAGIGMVLLAQLDVDSTYVAGGLPGLLVLGLGMGMAMPGSIQTATLGVEADHAGVASAIVSPAQQIGSAVGIAALNTLAASAAAHYVRDHAASNPPAHQTLLEAQMSSYTTAFWWSAAIFLTVAVTTAVVFHPHNKDSRYAAEHGLVASGRA